MFYINILNVEKICDYMDVTYATTTYQQVIRQYILKKNFSQIPTMGFLC